MFKVSLAATLAAFALFAAGCNDLSTDVAAITPGGETSEGGASQTSRIGEGCEGESDTLCLSLKYVVYEKQDGTPVVSEAAVAKNISGINAIWKACNIAFQIDEYKSVNPRDVGLAAGSSAQYELDKIRRTFENDHTLLVVTTENWGTTKNAWTQMPGADVYGVVMEAKVGDFAPIIAHELGHYLDLGHTGESTNVMSTIIGSSSTKLSSSQCTVSRNIAMEFWARMLR